MKPYNTVKQILVLALIVVCAGCQVTPKCASWKSYPGALQVNQCEPYARKCASDLHRRGIEAYYVDYTWRCLEASQRHAVVLFQWQGEWFLVDNAWARPVRTKGKTLVDKVLYVSPYVTSVNCVYVLGVHGEPIKQLVP